MKGTMIHMVTGIVIPHSTRFSPFVHEFTSLADYQAVVRGYIEPISIEQPRMTLFANEEGKQQRLPLNRRATWLWWLHCPSSRDLDLLVGDVALVGADDSHGEMGNLPDSFTELLLATSRYKIEVNTVESPTLWSATSFRFVSYFDAAVYAVNLMQKWSQIKEVRVVAG